MCIPRIWQRRVIEAEPFEVWGGEPRRDLLYVDDAGEAVLYAVVTREAGGLALNVGREEPCADLAEANNHGSCREGNTRSELPTERKRIDIGDFVHRYRRLCKRRSPISPNLRRDASASLMGFVCRLTTIVGIWRATCKGSWSGTLVHLYGISLRGDTRNRTAPLCQEPPGRNTTACRQLRQIVAAARWSAARKFRAVLS